MSDHFEIYTDGSFRPPNYGAYAFIIVQNGQEYAATVQPIYNATINQTELIAIEQALRFFPEKTSIRLYSDSQYAINCLTKWIYGWIRSDWKTTGGRDVKNKHLIQSIFTLAKFHDVTFTWIRGHAGNAYNVKCDQMAREVTLAMMTQRLTSP